MNQWRKFQFFEESLAEGALPEDLRRSVTCSTSGRGSITLGTDEGLVHVADRSLRVRLSFLAHSGPVVRVHHLKQRNVIVSLGEEAADSAAPAAGGTVKEGSSPSASLKLWDLDRRGAHDNPVCFRTLDLFNSKFPPDKVTTMAVLEAPHSILLIAIGLASGAVDLVRTDTKHVSRVRLPPDGAAGGAPEQAVTGLGFRTDEDGATSLFAVAQAGVSLFSIASLSAGSPPRRQLIAPLGAPLHCVTMTNTQDLVVARPEAFYLYNDDGPGPCYAMECAKWHVGWLREYLVCVHVDARKEDRNLLEIYDLKNKLIVHSGVVPGEVHHVVCEGAMVAVLLKEGIPLVLHEKDMQSRLQMLFRKSLYGLALSLVQAHTADVDAIIDVVRKYGDHLYEMRDYEGAMAQYVRTIGQLEPSYVISKFVAAQRIQSLTLYLEKLHEAGAAGPDHTTLLLNCYTKLKDVAKLDKFIRGKDAESSAPGQRSNGAASLAEAAGTSVAGKGNVGEAEEARERGGGAGVASAGEEERARMRLGMLKVEGPQVEPLPFDAATVIKVCRTAGYFEQALYVAERSADHSVYLSIVFDDLGRFQEGLEYLAHLDADLRIRYLKEYGPLLVAHCPDDVTNMLLALCVTDWRHVRGGATTHVSHSGTPPLGPRSASSNEGDVPAPEDIRRSDSDAAQQGASSSKPPAGRRPLQRLKRVSSVATATSPMEFAELYVDQPVALMNFLEKFLEHVGDSPWHRDVHNALIELYLSYEVVHVGPAADLALPACARTDPETWAQQRLKVKEEKDKIQEETRETTASVLGSKAPLNRPGAGSSASGQAVIPGAPKLLGLPGSGSTSGPAATASSALASNATAEFEEGSRAWYLAKAGRLLRSGWPQQGGTPQYDPEQAVLSCQVHGFRNGLLFLYERLKLYKEVISQYMQEGHYKGLIASCKKLGDPSRGGDPSLWADVLTYFGEQGGGCEAEVREVLEAVERDSLLPPLIVLRALSKNKSLTVGVVRDYIARQLEKDKTAIEEDRLAIEHYQEETAKQKAELHELETSARVFQVSQCTACSSNLDLPAVHFLCMHSFHLRCMGDNEAECPVCAPAHRTVLEMRKSLQQSARDQDRFFQELHDSKDGFSVIAEYFGRNIMNPPQPSEDSPGQPTSASIQPASISALFDIPTDE